MLSIFKSGTAAPGQWSRACRMTANEKQAYSLTPTFDIVYSRSRVALRLALSAQHQQDGASAMKAHHMWMQAAEMEAQQSEQAQSCKISAVNVLTESVQRMQEAASFCWLAGVSSASVNGDVDVSVDVLGAIEQQDEDRCESLPQQSRFSFCR